MRVGLRGAAVLSSAMTLAAVLGGVCWPARLLAAAEKESAPAKSDPARGSKGTPAELEFVRQFEAFRDQLAKLKQIHSQFQLAETGARPVLRGQYNGELEQTKKLVPELLAAAEAAYRANPKNQDASDLLMANLVDALHHEHLTEAAKWSKLLHEGGCSNPGFANYAGIAEFSTNDFAAAKADLQQAAKEALTNPTVFDKMGQQDAKVVDEFIPLWEEEQKIRAKEAEADDLPRVKLTTSKGDIVVELFENEAPIATANFISLVEKHFYDGLSFHRVLSGFMAQGGDPTGSGMGGPGYSIPDECGQPNHRNHFGGSLSMAKSAQPDSGGSQFFLVFVPSQQTRNLDGKHTVFGRVVEGMDALENLQRIDPEKPSGVKPDKILKAVVVRKRNHAYEPVKQLLK